MNAPISTDGQLGNALRQATALSLLLAQLDSSEAVLSAASPLPAVEYANLAMAELRKIMLAKQSHDSVWQYRLVADNPELHDGIADDDGLSDSDRIMRAVEECKADRFQFPSDVSGAVK